LEPSGGLPGISFLLFTWLRLHSTNGVESGSSRQGRRRTPLRASWCSLRCVIAYVVGGRVDFSCKLLRSSATPLPTDRIADQPPPAPCGTMPAHAYVPPTPSPPVPSPKHPRALPRRFTSAQRQHMQMLPCLSPCTCRPSHRRLLPPGATAAHACLAVAQGGKGVDPK
jgi:hypothetical protein